MELRFGFWGDKNQQKLMHEINANQQGNEDQEQDCPSYRRQNVRGCI